MNQKTKSSLLRYTKGVTATTYSLFVYHLSFTTSDMTATDDMKNAISNMSKKEFVDVIMLISSYLADEDINLSKTNVSSFSMFVAASIIWWFEDKLLNQWNK